MSEFRAAQDLMGSIDDILQMPDNIFATKSGRDMIRAMAGHIDVASMAKIQQKDFLNQKMSYDQVVMACHEITSGIKDLIDSIEDMADVISEKKAFLKEVFEKFFDLPELILADYPRTDATIPIELCHPNAKLPTYAHDGDAGADVYAITETLITPKQTVIIPTGIKMAIPKGWMISVRPRSGLSAKTNLRIANTPGTIDANYLAEVGIILENTGSKVITINPGDRIAQFILERAYKAEFTLTDDVTKHTTENRANAAGEQGFGSTDKV